MTHPPAFPSEVAARLSALAWCGTFEAHLTVRADRADERDAFGRFCAERGVKCVLIELADGHHHSQPMTATYHHGELASVLGEVEALHRQLCEGGFPVLRVKLEAVASVSGVPESDDDAAAFPEGYFEFHAKLRLPADADLEPLRRLAEWHGARLSRNARKRSADGEERFVTLRVHGAGRRRAVAAFESLLADLATAKYTLVNQQREFSLYDGGAELDAGWLDPPTGRGGHE